jgi:tripartite-type tricarboxylate transporter receptor subunit TctC
MLGKLTGWTGMLLALLSPFAAAQQYPTKVVTIIVPAAAGGPTDTVARVLAPPMAKDLKGQVIIENAGGAGGTIGAGRVARSTGDGYTLYLYHIAHSTFPALYRKLAFDPIKDFEPVGRITDVPMTLVSKKDVPAKDFKELLAWIKANGKNVSIANAGIGSASHLCGLLLMQAINTQMTPVPYKGTGPAMNDLLGGQVDIMCDQTTNTTSHIKSGKIKVYAVTTKDRVESLKDVPTLDELGLKNFELSAWHALWAPKGTPKPVVEQLSKALQVALKDPTVIQRFADLATVPVKDADATPAALQGQLKSEIDRWGPIIKAAGQYAD